MGIQERLTPEQQESAILKANETLLDICLNIASELDIDEDEVFAWYHFRSFLKFNYPNIFRSYLKYRGLSPEQALEEYDFAPEISRESYLYGKRLFIDQGYAEHAVRTWNEKFEPLIRRIIN